MNWTSARILFAGLMMVVGTAGCGSGSSVADVYEVCTGACTGGTGCTQANTTVNGFTGTFCTNSCQFSSDCPEDLNLNPGVCVIVNGLGECYAGCPGNNAGLCPFNETCATTDNITFFCVP